MTKNYSIEREIVVSTIFGISVVFLISVLIIDRSIVEWLDREYDANLLAKARVLITLTKEFDSEVELDFADEFMPEFERKEGPEYFQLWMENGNVFEKSHSLGSYNLDLINSRDIGASYFDLVLPDGRNGRVVNVVFYPQIENKKLRTVERLSQQKKIVISVAKEIESLRDIVILVHSLLFLGSLVTIIILAIVTKYCVRKGLSPLYSVTTQLHKFDTKAMNERLELPIIPRELTGMVEQFNGLMDKLEAGFKREKQFSSDVAHELKTPIAELINIAEVAIKWPDDDDLKISMPTDVYSAGIQLEAIVNNLLALARCENGTVAVQQEKIDFTTRVESVWNRYKKKADAKQIRFSKSFCDTAEIESSALEIDLVLNNLVSNAIAYSPNGEAITAILCCENGLFEFSLTNRASQLEKRDLAYMFDRLWRKDSSRTSEHHSGLGLSLVKAYSHLLGFSLNVSMTEDQWFTVTLSNSPIE